MDFEKLRAEMVESQLKARGITNNRVLEAFRKVPRHLFVPKNIIGSAYDDCALPIGDGQTISQPYMVAIMTELLELKGDEKVLEVGTGSGYQAAILAELAKKVITMERVPALAERAKKLLAEMGYGNVEVRMGDGTEGYPLEAPYDGIVVTAACPDIPPPLIEQLAEGGRLVLPVGERYSQILTLVRKEKGKITTEPSIGCIFVPLIGKFGYRE
jgi:protein-L-isoaspartate(D-aspartate) O-methyltransferase